MEQSYNVKTSSFNNRSLECYACGESQDLPVTKLPMSTPTIIIDKSKVT